MDAWTTDVVVDALGVAEALEARALAFDGHPSLAETVWRDLEDPAEESLSLIAQRDGAPAAFAHLARSDTFAPRHWVLGFVTDPGARDEVPLRDLLDRAVAHALTEGGGRIVAWTFDPSERAEMHLEAAGFAIDRELLQMRVPLPRTEAPAWPPGIEVRTFEIGVDETAWLEVNNRAFANHPEQGGWIESTLTRRMSEPWFDPELFLVAFDDHGLAGFNWLKIHDAHHRDPALGEIFVIGVDPRVQGTGLGRALALAGLELVGERGVSTGLLYVAAENTSAVALYRSLGFEVSRVDRAYARAVEQS